MPILGLIAQNGPSAVGEFSLESAADKQRLDFVGERVDVGPAQSPPCVGGLFEAYVETQGQSWAKMASHVGVIADMCCAFRKLVAALAKCTKMQWPRFALNPGSQGPSTPSFHGQGQVTVNLEQAHQMILSPDKYSLC